MKPLVPIVLLASSLLTPAKADRILIPVVYNGPGANGSHWATMLSAINRSDQPWSTPDVGFVVIGPSCVIPEGCPATELRPGEFGYLSQPDTSRFVLSAPNGILLNVPDIDQEIAISGRITAGPVWGTQLPRIPERDFAQRSLLLSDVPTSNSTYRTLLRVYALDVSDTDVTVSFRDSPDLSRPPIASSVVHLRNAGSTASRPAFGELPISLPLDGLADRAFIIEIAAPPGVKFWAFCTITDNSTNAVTTITP